MVQFLSQYTYPTCLPSRKLGSCHLTVACSPSTGTIKSYRDLRRFQYPNLDSKLFQNAEPRPSPRHLIRGSQPKIHAVFESPRKKEWKKLYGSWEMVHWLREILKEIYGPRKIRITLRKLPDHTQLLAPPRWATEGVAVLPINLCSTFPSQGLRMKVLSENGGFTSWSLNVNLHNSIFSICSQFSQSNVPFIIISDFAEANVLMAWRFAWQLYAVKGLGHRLIFIKSQFYVLHAKFSHFENRKYFTNRVVQRFVK